MWERVSRTIRKQVTHARELVIAIPSDRRTNGFKSSERLSVLDSCRCERLLESNDRHLRPVEYSLSISRPDIASLRREKPYWSTDSVSTSGIGGSLRTSEVFAKNVVQFCATWDGVKCPNIRSLTEAMLEV